MGKNSKAHISQEMMEAIATIAGKAGAKAAAEVIAKERQKERESRYDRRLGNTELLLKNYRMFKEHCSRAVFDASQLDENAIDILDLMWGRDGKNFVESIKKSAQRTQIILRHIDEMLDAYAGLCQLSGREEEMRRMRSVFALYPPSTSEVLPIPLPGAVFFRSPAGLHPFHSPGRHRCLLPG